MDSGFGASGAPFEYAVAEAKSKKVVLKKVLFLTLYICWCLVLVGLGVAIKLIVPLLCFIPLSVWIIVFLTWRYTKVEYEYSFFSGVLTVSKIYGERSRRKMVEITIRDLSSVLPYTDENIDKANAYDPSSSFFAASSVDAPSLYILLWENSDHVRSLLCMEVNDKALKILKYYAPSAF